MRLLFALFFVCSFSLGLMAQEKLTFPDSYFGTYKGMLQVQSNNGTQEIEMTFTLAPTDTIGTYKYILGYKGQPARDYRLIATEGSSNRFVVDEKNDIVLDAYLYENTLVSIFEVQGSLITTTERFYDNSMDFEITVVKPESPNVTGGTSDEVPSVKSYPIVAVQKAHLVKQ